MQKLNHIDNGKEFDWGLASKDYAKYRDIYPDAFYQKLVDLGLCVKGQSVLDLGTGTGVLPRNMYRFGAKFTGVDISENQIKQAVELSKSEGVDIDYIVASAETFEFPDKTFDVVTAYLTYKPNEEYAWKHSITKLMSKIPFLPFFNF